MDKLLEKRIDDIRGLIGETDPENNALTLDPIAAVKTYFKKKGTDIETQKEILRELPSYKEFEGKEEELKKLHPWDPAFARDSKGIKDYIKNYDPAKGYICSVFATSKYDKLVFDRGTMSFIGAKTSRGKTTAMVSMAVDALLQGHKVLFATFEETDVQIYTRIVLNLAWKTVIENEEENEEFDDNNDPDIFRTHVNLAEFSPAKVFQSIIRCGGHSDYNPFRSGAVRDSKGNYGNQDEKDLKLLEEILKAADEKADSFFANGQLIIYSGYTKNFETYIDGLKNIDPGTVVFSDYIQKIPSPAKRAENRYIGIKQLLYDINTVVKENDLISINGAQFGRIDNKTDRKMKDSFTDESFQESSDIEQIADIGIGIGRDPADPNDKNSKDKMFFAVLKNRRGSNNPAKEFDLIDGRKFSFYATDLRPKKND